MATTYTTRAKLRKPGVADRTWNVPLNENADIVDKFNAIGALCVTLAETPSTTLNVAVSAGSFIKSDGTFVSYAGAATFACTSSSTCKLYLSDTGTLTQSTSAWPAANHVRLATVVTGATTITSVTDERILYPSSSLATYLPLAGGTLADGANIILGATTGTKIGTATTQKLGVWNATPVVQPAHADQAAMASQGQSTLTDSTGGSASTTLAAATNTQSLTDSSGGTATTTLNAISDTATKDAVASIAAQLATQRSLNTVLIDAIASLAARHAETKTDVANVRTLLARIRTDLVTVGLIKGSA